MVLLDRVFLVVFGLASCVSRNIIFAVWSWKGFDRYCRDVMWLAAERVGKGKGVEGKIVLRIDREGRGIVDEGMEA